MSTSGITYELALRLKNAGFPLKEVDADIRLGKGSREFFYDFFPRKAYWAPTLSELIEACEGKAKVLLNKGDGTGWAYAVDGFARSSDTPEEAVANLWLALNKN